VTVTDAKKMSAVNPTVTHNVRLDEKKRIAFDQVVSNYPYDCPLEWELTIDSTVMGEHSLKEVITFDPVTAVLTID
jgi:hypothetical protein